MRSVPFLRLLFSIIEQVEEENQEAFLTLKSFINKTLVQVVAILGGTVFLSFSFQNPSNGMLSFVKYGGFAATAVLLLTASWRAWEWFRFEYTSPFP